jgi:hypothetical protein
MYKDEPRFPFWDMVLLIFIYEEKFEFVKTIADINWLGFESSIRLLEERGYVKKHGPNPEDISMRKKGEDLFKKYLGRPKKKVTNNVHTWIEAWRAIFPPGSNNTGYRYRGNKLECLKKMSKFVDSTKYSEEEIFQATKNYVEKFRIKGYNYMQQAHNFIEKKGVGSTLESECESLKESNNNNEPVGYGNRLI